MKHNIHSSGTKLVSTVSDFGVFILRAVKGWCWQAGAAAGLETRIHDKYDKCSITTSLLSQFASRQRVQFQEVYWQSGPPAKENGWACYCQTRRSLSVNTESRPLEPCRGDCQGTLYHLMTFSHPCQIPLKVYCPSCGLNSTGNFTADCAGHAALT